MTRTTGEHTATWDDTTMGRGNTKDNHEIQEGNSAGTNLTK